MTTKIYFLIISFISFGLAAQNTDIIMNAGSDGTTVSTCLGGLYDSGGTGAGGPYGNNESFTVTVCPSVPGDFMTLVWTVFSLDPTNTSVIPNQTNADNITIYDGDDNTAPTLGTYRAGDLTAGDLFGATPANPTGCLTIEFNSNGTGTGDFNAQLSCETPCDPPLAAGMILNADNIAGDSIAVCVNEIVTFQDNGSTAGASGLFIIEDWVWSWGDGSDNDTLTSGAAITHTFSQPGQYTIQLTVIDDNDCVNMNATDIRVFVSTYPTFIPFPGDTTLCLGESITLAAQPDNYEQTWTGFPVQVQDTDNCMEDLTGIVQPTPLPITGFNSNTVLSNNNPVTGSADITSICVDIEHSFLGDFVLQVQCPTGQIMTLHQQGGGGTNLGDVTTVAQGIIDCNDQSTFGIPWTYCFDATATQTWAQAGTFGSPALIPNSSGSNSLQPGTYAPVDPLGFAALDGCPINGTWNLLFTDLWGSDDGSLPGWSINFDQSLYPPVTVFTPDIGGGSDSSYWDLTGQFIVSNSVDLDTITVTPQNAGSFNYTYFAINDFGCSFDSTVTISVDALQPISAGPDVTICGTVPVVIGPDSTTGATCNYDLLLIDSWQDGWNGNNIDITTSAGTFNSPGPAVDSLWISLPVVSGETIILDFNNAGAGAFDCEIQLYDGDGNLVYQDGQFGQPNNTPQPITVNCFVGYTFDWTPVVNFVSSPSSQNPLVNPPTETTYALTTFPIGRPLCATTDSVTVILGPQIDPGTDSIANLCIDALPVDLFDYLGGTPQTGGMWIDAAGNVLTMPVLPATLPAGVYEYRIDSLSCSLSAFVTVNIIAMPITIVLTDANCNSVANGSIDVTSIMANSYSIDGGLTWQFATLFDNLSAGSYDVVLASGPAGTQCQVDTTVLIGEPDSLQIIQMTTDLTSCPGDNVSLSAVAIGGNGNYTFTWDNGIGIGAALSYTPTQSATVCLTVTEDCPSPPATNCFDITVPADINFNYHFGNDEMAKTTAGCYEHEFVIKNTSTSIGTAISPAPDMSLIQTTWNIVNGKTLSSGGLDSLNHAMNTPGVYDMEVTITTADGCVYEEYLNQVITVWDHPEANFSYTPEEIGMFSPEATMIDMSEGDPVAWNWTFEGQPTPASSDIQNPEIIYPSGKPGSYNIDLEVTDVNGCTDLISRQLIISNDINVFAPNMFTPDGDGYNDLWRLYITGIEIYDYHLVIYNRWGEPVYESFDSESGWNGRYGNNGDVVMDGTYVWSLRAKDIVKDKYHEFNGSILIMR